MVHQRCFKGNKMGDCVDYRALNKVTVQNTYPNLLIANLFD